MQRYGNGANGNGFATYPPGAHEQTTWGTGFILGAYYRADTWGVGTSFKSPQWLDTFRLTCSCEAGQYNRRCWALALAITYEQWRRHEMPPGMAGPALAAGRNALSWEDKFAADVAYVDHWSLWLDAKVLVLSVWRVLRREGVSAEGHATMPRFEGERVRVNGE